MSDNMSAADSFCLLIDAENIPASSFAPAFNDLYDDYGPFLIRRAYAN